jgi:hypothetical protein
MGTDIEDEEGFSQTRDVMTGNFVTMVTAQHPATIIIASRNDAQIFTPCWIGTIMLNLDVSYKAAGLISIHF